MFILIAVGCREKNGERSSFEVGLKHVPVIGIVVVEANIIEMFFFLVEILRFSYVIINLFAFNED